MKFKFSRKSSFLILALMLLISVVTMGAKPSYEKKFDLKLPYLETNADQQFEESLQHHFKAKPNKQDKIVVNVKVQQLHEENMPDEYKYEAIGNGTIHIDGKTYPFDFKDPILVDETDSGEVFYHGNLEGTIKIKGNDVPAVFVITSIPSEDKTLITVGIDDISGEPVGLAFGATFDEYFKWQDSTK